MRASLSVPCPVSLGDKAPIPQRQAAQRASDPKARFCPQSILNVDKGWRPGISIKQILLGIQNLLDQPNNDDAAQTAAHTMMKKDIKAFWERVAAEVKRYPDPNGGTQAAGGAGAHGASDDCIILG